MDSKAKKMLSAIYKKTGGTTDVPLDRDLGWVEKLEAEEGLDIDDEGRLLAQFLADGLLRRGDPLDWYYLTPKGIAAAEGGR